MIRLSYPIREVNYITAPFGFSKFYPFGNHKGVDFRTKHAKNPSGIGTPIRACARGKWKEVGNNKIYGNYVLLEHDNGYETFYAHLDYTTFKEGYKEVRAGDIIGKSGNKGMSTGPHLHFELRENGVKIDPMKGFEEGRRLKEWARSRALMKVEDDGSIKFLVKGGIVDLKKSNCWDIISKNTWGISDADYRDLLDLL